MNVPLSKIKESKEIIFEKMANPEPKLEEWYGRQLTEESKDLTTYNDKGFKYASLGPAFKEWMDKKL